MSIAFTRRRSASCLSDLQIDRLMTGELSGEQAAQIRRHTAQCDACSERVREFEADRAEFQALQIPLPATKATTRRSPRAMHIMGWISAAAACAVLAIGFQHVTRTNRNQRNNDLQSEISATRTKGEGRLRFFVLHDGLLRRGGPGERVAPGDTLQWTVTSARPVYVAILSLDATHRASAYFPTGARAQKIGPGDMVPLPQSVVLDQTLGRETIEALFCSEPIALEPLRAQLERAGTIEANSCSTEHFEIEKSASGLEHAK